MDSRFSSDTGDSARPMQRRKLTVQIDESISDMDCDHQASASKRSPIGVLRPPSTPEAVQIAATWAKGDGEELRTFYEASRRRVLWAFLEAQQAVEIARIINGDDSANSEGGVPRKADDTREAVRRAETLRAEVVGSSVDIESQQSKSHFCGWWGKDSKIHSVNK